MSDDSIRVLGPAAASASTPARPRPVHRRHRQLRRRRCTPGCPTARTPSPGRPSPPTATPSPAPSPSPSARPPRPPSPCPTDEARRRPGRRALRHRALRRLRRASSCWSAAPPSCWPAGRAARRAGPCSGSSSRGWVTLTAATLVMLLLRGPYTGSGQARPTSSTSAGCRTCWRPRPGAALVSRLLLLAAAALFIAVLFGAYDEARRTTREKQRPRPSGSASAAPSSPPGSPRPGRWPSTPRPASSRASRCPSTCCTCWPSRPGSAGSPRCWSRSTGRRRSSGRPCAASPGSPSAACSCWPRPGSTSPGGRSAPGRALTGTSYGQLLLVKVALVARPGRRRLDLAAVDGAAGGGRGEARSATDSAAEADAGTARSGGDGRRTGAGRRRPERRDGRRRTVRRTATTPTTGGAGPASAGDRATPRAPPNSPGSRPPWRTARQKRQRDADPERSGLRRSVLAEAAVAVVLLAVTTVLTATEPGRTEEEAGGHRGGAVRRRARPPARSTLTMPVRHRRPGRQGHRPARPRPRRSAGGNALHVCDRPARRQAHRRPRGEGRLHPAGQGASARCRSPPTGSPTRATGRRAGSSSRWPGNWQVAVTVRTSDIDQVTVDKNVKIG